MKLKDPIVCDDGSILEEVNPVNSGIYFLFRVLNVQRGIRGKTCGKVDELLIVGVPWSKVDKFAEKYGFRIKML